MITSIPSGSDSLNLPPLVSILGITQAISLAGRENKGHSRLAGPRSSCHLIDSHLFTRPQIIIESSTFGL